MSAVSVIHDFPMAKGGAEAVFMHTLEALQDNFDVTAITAAPFDVDHLNSYFNTDVSDIQQTIPSIPILKWNSAYNWITRLTSGKLGVLHARRLGFFHWAAVKSTQADLIIHTKSESPFGNPSLQYIHHPMYRRYRSTALDSPDNRFLAYLEGLTTPLADAGDFPPEVLLLTNSAWSATDFESVYGVRPLVCPPPVVTDDIPDPLPENERENSVLVVGRIDEAKRQHLAFEIVERVRNRGFDLDLSVVGPVTNDRYADQITELAAKRDWATVHGPVSRGELVDMLSSYRYGLHCHPREHFGIVVAEMVAGGVLPLVPGDGGQVDIVNERRELIWNSTDDAVEKLYSLCKNEYLRGEVKDHLPSIDSKYGTQRFRKEMRSHVNSLLNQTEQREGRDATR